MKKSLLFTFCLLLTGALTASAETQSHLRIGPFINYGVDLTTVDVPGATPVNNMGYGAGLKLGYGWEYRNPWVSLGFDFGVLGSYQTRTSKTEVPGVSTVENTATNLPIMAFIQPSIDGAYLIGGIGNERRTFLTKTSVNNVGSTSSETASSGLCKLVGIGYSYAFGPSDLELQMSLQLAPVEGTEERLFMVSAGYNFGIPF